MSKIFNFVINGRRLFALVAMLLTTAVAAFAQDIKVTIDNFEIAAGETTTVNINVENTVACGQTFTGDIYLPEGLVPTPTQQTSGGLPVYVTKTTRFSKSHTASSATANENPNLVPEDGEGSMIRFSVTSLSGKTLAPGEGAVLTISVTAEKGYEKAPGKIELKDATITDDKGKIVSVKATGYVNAAISLDAFDVEATPNQESVVTIFMNNQAIIAGLDAVITLPEGLTFVENADEEYCTEADRTSMHVVSGVVNAKTPNVMKVLISAMPPVNIDGEEGAIFSFIVKGDAKLAETSEITITKVHASSLRGEKYDIPDLTISVTNPDVAAATAIDEAVKALKDDFAAAQEALKAYDEDIQAELADDVDALAKDIQGLEQTVANAKATGTLAANFEQLEDEIEALSGRTEGLINDAADAQDEKDEAAAKEAENAQYKQNVADVAALRKALDDAKAAAEKAGVDAASDAKAAENAINDFSAKVEGNHAANKSVEAADEIAKAKDAAQAKIDVINDAVAAKANAEQAVKDGEAILAVQKSLDDAKATIAGYADEVQTGAADAVAAAQKAIDDAKAAADKSAKDGTAVADAEANAKAIEAAKAAVEKAAADAAAAQKAYEEAAAKANEEQAVKDGEAILAVEKALNDAKAAIAGYADEVQAGAADAVAAAQKALDDAKAAAEKSKNDGTAVADADANAKAIEAAKAAVEKAAADAAAAQKAYEEEHKLPAYELADGDYIIKNVATGKYLGGANSWGTQASLVESGRIFTATKLENGKYTLDSHTYNNANSHFLGKNGYVDNDDKELTLVAVNGGAAIGKSDTEFFGAPAEGTVLAVMQSDDANAVWQFISIADAVKEIEEGKATDATFLLKDASISRNLYNANFEAVWEGDDFGKGGANENQNAEKWGGNSQIFDVYQTIELPNGKYKLTVNGYYRYNNTTDNTNDIAVAAHADGTEVINSYFYANDEEVALKSIADDEAAAALENLPFSQADATKAFEQGLYLNELEVEVTDGELMVGIMKKDHPGCDWTVWDNFKLTYLGKLGPAAADIADGDYLIKNVATGKYLGGGNSWGTQASLVESGRIFTATKLENGKYTLDSHTYNNANDHFLGKNGYVDNGDKELTLAAVQGGIAIGTSEEAFFGAPAEGTALAAGLKADDANAVWQFISIADAVKELEEGKATDATFLLKDASISRNLYNSNFEAVWEGDAFGKGGANENQNAEKWGGNSQEFDVHQTISLPNGFYKITVNGYYRYNNTTDNTNDIAIAAHADGTEVINTYLYANDAEVALKSIADDEAAAALESLPFSQGDASKAFEQGLYLNELEVEVTDGELIVGIIKKDHPGCDWTVWDNFTITKINGENPGELVYTDLTQAMFKHWTAADETGEVVGDVNCAYVIGASTDMPYGDGSVSYLNYADLSEYENIVVVATEGEPRLLFNRVVDQGTVNVEVPRDAATYETVVDNGDGSKTYTVDIAKIVAEYGFAHLHAIKGANWNNTTVTSMKLGKAGTPEIAKFEWFYDFEADKEGVAIVGGGAIVDDEVSTFGKVFENVGGAIRTNYLTLPEDVLAHSAESKELSIAFWVNANGKAFGDYTYAPFFTAYGTNTNGAANGAPMLALQSRGNVQTNVQFDEDGNAVDNGNWCDFNGDTHVDGKPNIYNKNAWEAGDAAFNFVENWLDDGEWHFYTVTFTETGVKQYLDGDITNEWTLDGTAGKSVNGLLQNGDKLKYICLGGNQAWDWWDGDAPFRFDDVFITNYVLTEDDIDAIMLAKAYTPEVPKDDWFTDSDISFKVNDYPNGVDKDAVADPRWDAEEGCIIVTSNDNPSNDYDAQLFIVLPEKLQEGTEITLTMRVKADRAQSGCGAQAHNTPGDYNHWACVDGINFTTEWADYSSTITVSAAMAKGNDGNGNKDGMGTIAFNLADMTNKTSNNFYFDDIAFEYTIPTAIADIEKAATKANGKYFENGKVVIIKNGVKYNAGGVMVK